MRSDVLALSALLFGTIAGCTPGDDRGTVSFKDQGKICVSPPSMPIDPGGVGVRPVRLPEGEALAVAVRMPDCLSSSCSHDPRAQCQVQKIADNRFRVTSEGSYKDRGNTCTLDCGSLVARCQTEPLPAGTYTFEHGAERLTVTLPADLPAPPCAGM